MCNAATKDGRIKLAQPTNTKTSTIDSRVETTSQIQTTSAEQDVSDETHIGKF